MNQTCFCGEPVPNGYADQVTECSCGARFVYVYGKRTPEPAWVAALLERSRKMEIALRAVLALKPNETCQELARQALGQRPE